MLVDIHAHLDDEKFKNKLDSVLAESKLNNVKYILNNGINPISNRKTLELSKNYSMILPSLGLYPLDAIKLTEEEITNELIFIKKSFPIAIGEVGLDKYWNPESIKQQMIIFEKIISLTEQLKIPIIVHTRKAEQESLDILESSKIKQVILHSFQGNKIKIKRAIDLGYNFSIPPNIIKNSSFQTLVKMANLSNLFTETDAPYLGPDKNEINTPKNIKYTIAKISELKKLDPIEVENHIYMNFQKVFL